MQIREIVKGFAVSPQVTPADMAELASRGYRTVICNRPDIEVSDELNAAAVREAAAAAGLAFVEIPIDTRSVDPEAIDAQGRAISASSGPVLAYCLSGTRSCIAWALSEVGKRPGNEIIAAAARAGYDLKPYRAALGE